MRIRTFDLPRSVIFGSAGWMRGSWETFVPRPVLRANHCKLWLRKRILDVQHGLAVIMKPGSPVTVVPDTNWFILSGPGCSADSPQRTFRLTTGLIRKDQAVLDARCMVSGA